MCFLVIEIWQQLIFPLGRDKGKANLASLCSFFVYLCFFGICLSSPVSVVQSLPFALSLSSPLFSISSILYIEWMCVFYHVIYLSCMCTNCAVSFCIIIIIVITPCSAQAQIILVLEVSHISRLNQGKLMSKESYSVCVCVSQEVINILPWSI